MRGADDPSKYFKDNRYQDQTKLRVLSEELTGEVTQQWIGVQSYKDK